MKKFLLFLLVALILGSQSLFSQEIDHEKVMTDGYQKVTKGAYWAKRPEAKLVYNGETPEGVEVIVLDSEHFVRFAKGEHNPLDINYIVFPAGEKIYKKNGQYFAAICGNRIDTWRPVEKVVEKIVEKTVEKETVSASNLSFSDNNQKPIDFGGKVTTEKTPEVNPSVLALGKTKKDRKDKTWVGRNLAWLIPLAAVLVAGSGFLLAKELKKGAASPHGTMSGGRPADVPETNTGGTGGRGD